MMRAILIGIMLGILIGLALIAMTKDGSQRNEPVCDGAVMQGCEGQYTLAGYRYGL